MIYTSKKPTSQDLSEPFAVFLQWDTVAHLKEAFSLMGRRFIGQPKKSQIANGIARYVSEHPLDVLQKCKADSLMYIKKMIEMGKGSCITLEKPDVYDLQIQDMELVLTYNDKSKGSTELYLLDELHDIFAPHIDEAYRHPSPTLQDDMLKGLEDLKNIAEGCKTEDDFLKKLKASIPEIDFDELFGNKVDDDIADDDDELEEKPGQFSYACSMPMLDDIRALRYDAQAEVCKAFHKMIQKGFPTDDSFLIKRFEETYKEIVFRHLDDSLDEIHYAVNDLDNAIYEIDMIDPMTFFDVERKLAPIIKRSPKKGEDIQ